MGIGVGGHAHPHLHHPCPRCGYATRFKQHPTRCGCSDSERPKIDYSQESRDIEVVDPVVCTGPVLQVADRYAGGRSTRRLTERTA